MKKYTAFTMAETLLVMAIIGILAVFSMKNLRTKDIEAKTFAANTFKVMEFMQQASTKIMGSEPDLCPDGAFITRVLMSNAGALSNRTNPYEYEYSFYSDVSNEKFANTNDTLNAFGNYLRFEKRDFYFCEHSKYCETANIPINTNLPIKGAKIAGNIYIGFQVYANSASSLHNCPTKYYLPNHNAPYTPIEVNKNENEVRKCWGNFYVDLDGIKGNGVLGQDVFMWGLGTSGLEY